MDDSPTTIPNGRAVALDGGTSTTRARLVEGDRILAESRRGVGVRDVVLAGESSPLAEAVRACLDELEAAVPGMRSLPIVAAGMLSSEVGLAAIPHVVAPAGLAELAAGARAVVVPGVSEAPVFFVPGVRTPPGDGPLGWAEADLMRGEECETLGAIGLLGLAGPLALLWPGSHTKLVAVDATGRIARSTTSLAGEMTDALARRTILARSLPEAFPEHPDPDAVAAGFELVGREGLGRAAFLVRIADVSGALTPGDRAAFWVGAVIGDDAARLARHPILRGGVPLFVGGREPQRSLYAARLGELLGRPATALGDRPAAIASAIGAIAVATAAGWLTSR